MKLYVPSTSSQLENNRRNLRITILKTGSVGSGHHLNFVVFILAVLMQSSFIWILRFFSYFTLIFPIFSFVVLIFGFVCVD